MTVEQARDLAAAHQRRQDIAGRLHTARAWLLDPGALENLIDDDQERDLRREARRLEREWQEADAAFRSLSTGP